MITWITGESGAGKTTLAKKMKGEHDIWLDADQLRPIISSDLKYTLKNRLENNLRFARLANLLSEQGHDVIVSTICPTDEIKQQVYWICKCRFIEVRGKFDAV